MFDKAKFKEVLEKARGYRSNQEYADECGVSRAYISKYLNLRLNCPPTPQVIKKLANKAINGITYNDLMIAAGYMNSNEELDKNIKYTEDLPFEAIKEIQNFIEYIRYKYKKR